MINKEAIKEFLKPDRKKIVIFIILLIGILAYKDNIYGIISGKYYIENSFCYSDVLDNCDGKKVRVEGILSEGKMTVLQVTSTPDEGVSCIREFVSGRCVGIPHFGSKTVLLSLSSISDKNETYIYELAKNKEHVMIVGYVVAGKEPADKFTQNAMCKNENGQFGPCSTIVVEKVELLK